MKLPHVNKKPLEKPNFCSNTVFSLYFKIRAKKIHAAKPLAFSLHFLFRRDQNHYSIDFKNHENVWTDLKKNIAGRIPEVTRSTKTSQKAEAITFFIKPLTHYLRWSDLKIGEN